MPIQRYIDRCSYTEKYEPEHTYTFTGPCQVTGSPHAVTVLGSELFAYRQTNRIMEFKSLSADDREFLISGTSPLGWKVLFGEHDEINQAISHTRRV